MKNLETLFLFVMCMPAMLWISGSLGAFDPPPPTEVKRIGEENLQAFVSNNLVDYKAGECKAVAVKLSNFSYSPSSAPCTAIHSKTKNPVSVHCSYIEGFDCTINPKNIKLIKQSADYNMTVYTANALPGYRSGGCLGDDRDDDKYVSCTASPKDLSKKPATYECPYDNQLGVCKTSIDEI